MKKYTFKEKNKNNFSYLMTKSRIHIKYFFQDKKIYHSAVNNFFPNIKIIFNSKIKKIMH